MEIENPYKVTWEDIKVGKMFFIFTSDGFKQILIGPGLRIGGSFCVNFNGERNYLSINDLWSRLPDDWKGRVKYL